MSEIITFAPVTAAGAEFAVPFPYLDRAHVKLYINGVEDTTKEWISDGSLKAGVSVNPGDICVVKRETPRSALIRTLPTTGTLQSDDVNHQSLQAVYVATEAADGLREGLALDEATLTYWEGAPTGSNRTLKDVVDPSASTEAVTKNYYDTTLTTQISAAQTSATNASSSAGNAATYEATALSQSQAATTSATNAAVSEATASSGAATATTGGTNASDAADEAEAWANTAVSTEVTYDNPNPINDAPSYSAKHWASQASTHETTAAAANATAQATAAAASPRTSLPLLDDEEGWAINWAYSCVSVRDFTDGTNTVYAENFRKHTDTHWAISGPIDNDYANYDRRHQWSDYGTPQTEFHPSLDLETGLNLGYSSYRNTAEYCPSAYSPGNSVWGGSTVNCTDANNSTYKKMLDRGNQHTKVTMTASGGGLNYYVNQPVGRSGVNYPAGWKIYCTLMIKYGDWNDFILELDLPSNSTNYKSGVIDLNSGGTPTHTAGDFTRSKMFTVDSDGEPWYMFVFEAPAQLSNCVFSSDNYRLYFTDGTDLTPATGGDGTSHVYMAFMGIQRHSSPYVLSNATIAGSGIHALSLEPQANVAGPMTYCYPVTGGMPTARTNGFTFWVNLYLPNTELHALPATEQQPDLCGVRELGKGWWIWYDAVEDDLVLSIEEQGVTTKTNVVIATDIGVDGWDNNLKGTQVQVVFTGQNDQYDIYYRINQGAKQTYNHTEVTNTDFTGLGFDATFPGFYNDNGIQLSGIIRYSGYFTRYITSSEADRYLNWT